MVKRIKSAFGITWLLDMTDVTIPDFSEVISELSEEAQKTKKIGKQILSRIMFCDELMTDYFENGYRKFEVRLSRKFGNLKLSVLIRGQERRIDVETSKKQNNSDKDEVQLSIQRYILRNVSEWTNYRYIGGVNEFEIILREKDEELCNQILSLYDQRGEEIREKPLLLMAQIARLDPGRSIGVIVNRVIKRGALMLIPVCVAEIIDGIIAGVHFFSAQTMLWLLAAFLLVVVNCICNNRLDYYFMSQRNIEIENALKSAVLKKMQMMSFDFMSKTPSGGVLSKIIRDTEGIRPFILKVINSIVEISTDLTVIIIMTVKDCPQMLIFYVITVPISAILITYYKKPIVLSNERHRKTAEKANSVIRDMQEMWQVTRLHGIDRTEYNLVSHQLKKVRQAASEAERVRHLFSTVCFFCFQFFQLLCLAFSIYLASVGIISIGMVVMFRSYFESLVNSVTKAIDALPEISKGYESLRSLNEILSSNEYEPDGDYVLTNPISGEIEFKDVVFSYPGADSPVIDHLSFRIPAGKSVALTGGSGVGKTTIINLITGLLQKQSGEILIDGVEIDSIKKSSYRRQIAVVPQSTVMFAGTLFENIVYGMNFISSKEIYSVLDRLGLSDMINNMPKGLDTEVKELGNNFSGGQRQRISIARAMLRSPRLLLFDEATSALDGESETQVQKAIDGMMGQCTIVMIAHRLTTIRNCDLIFGLKPGGIVDIYNSYDEFIASKSNYK